MPGPATRVRLGAVARDHGVHLVVGVVERDGGTLYCTALIFGPDGALLGKHRKLMPTAMERVIWGSGDGSTLPGRGHAARQVGAVICWENYMPLLRTAMYAKGVELYCAPTVDDRETWLPTMRHIALRRPLLRAVGVPVRAARRLARRLPSRVRRRPATC